MGQVRYLGRKAVGTVRIGDVTKLASGQLQVLGDKTFEWRTSGSAAAGHVGVVVGVDEATCATNLAAAINANKPTQGCTAVVDPVDNKVVRIAADAPGSAGNLALTNTVGDASYVNGAATLLGGDNGGKQFVEEGVYVVQAVDVTATNIMIPLEVTNPRNLVCQYRKSTGEEHLSITDKAVISTVGGVTFLKIFQAGATHLGSGDEVHYQVNNG